MKTTWLLSSSIYTKHGVFNPEGRAIQTMGSILSIKERIPDAKIIILDASDKRIADSADEDHLSKIKENVDLFVSLKNDVDIIQMHNTAHNHDVAKNMMEVTSFLKLFNYADTSDTLATYLTADRVFKLSGRYQLTDDFNLDLYKYPATKNKIVFKSPKPAWINFAECVTEFQLMARMFSFPGTALSDIKALYNIMHKNMVLTMSQNQYIDIEHSLYRFVDLNKVTYVDKLGVEGNLAPNGMLVID